MARPVASDFQRAAVSPQSRRRGVDDRRLAQGSRGRGRQWAQRSCSRSRSGTDAAGAPRGAVDRARRPLRPAGRRDRLRELQAGQPGERVGHQRRCGDPTIQGFATRSASTTATRSASRSRPTPPDYRLDIYRLGYYGGDGARQGRDAAAVGGAAPDPAGLPDAGTPPVSSTAATGRSRPRGTFRPTPCPGVYFAQLVRTDTGGDSHIDFVVRDDDGQSDLLFQTSDTTWQAYNRYGGNSLYVGVARRRPRLQGQLQPPVHHARLHEPVVFFWAASTRWCAGSSATATTSATPPASTPTARGAELLEHEAFLSVGHDEYWSAGQRANVEAARDAGVNLAFFSGNEVFWKTRWENSIDGAGTPYRTLVSYKETQRRRQDRPGPGLDGHVARRALQPAGGRRPARERAHRATLHRQRLPQRRDEGAGRRTARMRFWRNTSVADAPAGPGRHVRRPGSSATSGTRTSTTASGRPA